MIIYSLICLQTVLNSLDLFRVDVGMELILLKDIRTRRTFDFSSTVLVLSICQSRYCTGPVQYSFIDAFGTCTKRCFQ